MTRTYYEVLNDAGEPATARQKKALGSAVYGYKSRVVAESRCPGGCVVQERHEEMGSDWAGRVVSLRTIEGRLVRCL